MRPAYCLIAMTFLLATACAEHPRCVNIGSETSPNIIPQCNAGFVPVCGTENEELYQSTGANRGGLLPVSGREDGTCPDPVEGQPRRCRPRVLCASEGAEAVCPDGQQPGCRLGEEMVMPGPTPDAGPPPPVDAGPAEEDAGPVDEDAGPAEDDAGPVDDDAGPVDDDAGV